MNYILPNFYDSYVCNEIVIKEYPSLFITGLEGSYPYCIFNGSPNNTRGVDLCVHKDILKSTKQERLYLINLSSVIIPEEKYYHDEFTKVILEDLMDRQNLYFEVADENFVKYLASNYPHIKLILHFNYFFNHETEDALNLIKNYPQIKGVIFNLKYINISDFNCLPKNFIKIGYLPLFNCINCANYAQCHMKDMENIFNFSRNTIFETCSHFSLRVKEDIIRDRQLFEKEVNYLLFETVPLFAQFEAYKTIESVLSEEVK